MFANLKGTFGRNYVTINLQEETCVLKYEKNYTDNSFGRVAATSTRLAELSEEKIQLLNK